MTITGEAPTTTEGSTPSDAAQQQFIDTIQQQVRTAVGSQLDGPFEVVSYPSGFHYGITYGSDGYYNVATLGDLDMMLGTSSSGRAELTGASFAQRYLEILDSVVFSFSAADRTTMETQDNAAYAQIAAVEKAFLDAGFKYSATPPAYGGKIQDILNQMQTDFGGIDGIPFTFNDLANALKDYRSMAAASSTLHDRWSDAEARLKAATTNATKPTSANGGMQVADGMFVVGYTPEKLPTAIRLLDGLNTTSNAVSIQMALAQFDSDTMNVQIAGGAQLRVPIAGILTLEVEANASYDLSRYTMSSSSVTMSCEYPGVTLVSAEPSILSADGTTGWYDLDILNEVVTNTGDDDATGYKLDSSEFSVTDQFGPGKAFSRLKTFVISQQPTITMTFTSANSHAVQSDLKVGASVKVGLFGLFSAGASGSYTVSKVDTDSQSESVTVTFGPPQLEGTIPLEEQVAYVLGGVASYPPDNV